MSQYFIHLPAATSSPIYWRAVQTFAGIPIHINLNLLAQSLGDPLERIPRRGFDLVPTQSYGGGTDFTSVTVQPRVFTNGLEFREMAIGPRLKRFLDYPVGDFNLMNLRPPFYDSTLGIGDTGGGWFAQRTGDRAWHGGFDVVPGLTGPDFEVCASASGTVIGVTNGDNSPVVLEHRIGRSRFITVYQHLDLRAGNIRLGQRIGRGEPLGRTTQAISFPHLHFMVAVSASIRLGPGAIILAWFAIDPFGVYDYYKQRTSTTLYNYLPDRAPNCWDASIRGACHPVQWERQPLSSLL